MIRRQFPERDELCQSNILYRPTSRIMDEQLPPQKPRLQNRRHGFQRMPFRYATKLNFIFLRKPLTPRTATGTIDAKEIKRSFRISFIYGTLEISMRKYKVITQKDRQLIAILYDAGTPLPTIGGGGRFATLYRVGTRLYRRVQSKGRRAYSAAKRTARLSIRTSAPWLFPRRIKGTE